MSASTRYALVSLVALSWLAAGCGSSKKVDLGGGCLINSDCNSPLSCAFGKCHTACAQTRDCPLGQSCVSTPEGGVCQLAAEASCEGNMLCAQGLLCAVDYRCRAACTSDGNCRLGQKCVGGVCADSSDLDPTGQLPPKNPAYADSGVDAVLCPTGSETCACYPNDTCNAGLTCASHLCVRLSATGGSGGSDLLLGTGGALSGTGGRVGTGGSATNVDGSPADGGATNWATIFVSDALNGYVYRFNVTPNTDPVLTATITAASATGLAIGPTGELFVAQQTAAGSILRFKSPLTTPTPNGTIVGVGATYLFSLVVVDNELWGDNTGNDGCSSDPQSIVRLAFDSQGVASAVGNVTTNLIGANRGMLWVPAVRSLYVTQCTPTKTIQHFQVATDHSVTALAPITGNGLDNPHGMAVAPWGELLVANAGANQAPNGPATAPGTTLLRFTLDAQGNVTPSGTIQGNGVYIPLGMAFAPWGELFVVNCGTSSLSRFTFDSSHAAVPHGVFQLNTSSQAKCLGLNHITVVDGASTSLSEDAGMRDSSK
jgi:hypothetical protein